MYACPATWYGCKCGLTETQKEVCVSGVEWPSVCAAMSQSEVIAMLRNQARKVSIQTSLYRGVSLLKQTHKWHAQINMGGKQVHISLIILKRQNVPRGGCNIRGYTVKHFRQRYCNLCASLMSFLNPGERRWRWKIAFASGSSRLLYTLYFYSGVRLF